MYISLPEIVWIILKLDSTIMKLGPAVHHFVRNQGRKNNSLEIIIEF